MISAADQRTKHPLGPYGFGRVLYVILLSRRGHIPALQQRLQGGKDALPRDIHAMLGIGFQDVSKKTIGSSVSISGRSASVTPGSLDTPFSSLPPRYVVRQGCNKQTAKWTGTGVTWKFVRHLKPRPSKYWRRSKLHFVFCARCFSHHLALGKHLGRPLPKCLI